MNDTTILTISADHGFLSLLQQQLQDQQQSPNQSGGARLVVAATVDEACSLLSTVRPRLVVVNATRQGVRYEQLDQLLWTTTVLARRVPVLVIADRYRTDQAITLYRMGVTEYISRTHHLDQWGRILRASLPPAPVGRRSPAPTDEPGTAVNSWMAAALPRSARVI